MNAFGLRPFVLDEAPGRGDGQVDKGNFVFDHVSEQPRALLFGDGGHRLRHGCGGDQLFCQRRGDLRLAADLHEGDIFVGF